MPALRGCRIRQPRSAEIKGVDRLNYEEAIEKIHSFHVFGSRLGLERMKKLLELLGSPHINMKIIHVAGTNGKGSVCRYIYSVLEENGYRTGAYFSPYIENFTERIEFDRQEISREDLVIYTEAALHGVDEMLSLGYESPTEFELVTAIGLLYFASKQADYVVLEVGLGGKGDSTNICDRPEVTAITSISYDHMAQLGNTLELIAADKAGIIKKGVPVVVNVDDPGAFGVIRDRAAEVGAPLIDLKEDRLVHIDESLEGYAFDAILADGTRYKNIRLSMCGRHQLENALCALHMIEILRRSGAAMTEEGILKGMWKARQKGRFEIVRTEPYLILDGAHNPAGAKALTDTVMTHFAGKRILLCTGILADKAFQDMAAEFIRLSADIIVTEVPNPRRMKAKELADAFCTFDLYAEKRKNITVIPDYEEAFAFAEGLRENYDLILWAGSLYLIGGVRRMITCMR